jgi:hypothetical protein
MKRENRNLLLALVAAIAVTFGLLGGAYVTSESHEAIARALYWQGYWLQSLVPAPNIGTAEHPLYEATPVHVVAFFAGIPLGILVYYLIALAVLRFAASGPASPNKPFQRTRSKQRASER